MLLSEAIRLGAMLRPQAFNGLFSWGMVVVDELISSCALGAAAEAIGLNVRDEPCMFADKLGVEFPQLYWYRTVLISCPEPECDDRSPHLANMIVHLNDKHRWTREAIADWVASVEPPPAEANVINKEDAVCV